MGYFDALVNSSFDQDISGRWTFYPWGTLGKGYVLTGDEQLDKLRNNLKYSYMALFPVGIILPAIHLGFGAILLLIIIPAYIIFIKKTTRNLESTPHKLKLTESCEISARSHSLFSLIIMEFVMLLFAVFGLWACLDGDLLSLFVGMSIMALSGLASIPVGCMIKSKRAQKRH